MLSGASGQLYGNHYTWTFESGWQQNLNTPGTRQLQYMKDFFSARQWWDLVPDQTHTVVIKVEHPDGEQLVRIDGSADAQLNPGVDPEMPVGGALVVPLMTQFRREGRYEVSLTVNGDLFWMSPLRVRSALPQV